MSPIVTYILRLILFGDDVDDNFKILMQNGDDSNNIVYIHEYGALPFVFCDVPLVLLDYATLFLKIWKLGGCHGLVA